MAVRSVLGGGWGGGANWVAVFMLDTVDNLEFGTK